MALKITGVHFSFLHLQEKVSKEQKKQTKEKKILLSKKEQKLKPKLKAITHANGME